MTGKSGWQLGFVFAVSLSLSLSVLTVWQEAARWRAVDELSLASRYVGTPNKQCCQQAILEPCTPCLTSPTCTAGSTSTGYCATLQGMKTNTASCVGPVDNLFCDTSVLVQGTANVKQCVLTGNTLACQGGGTQCEIDGAETQTVTTPYAGCNGQVDRCTSQPKSPCMQNR
jgi:hypothetical protein